jgi:hypothetical protein
MIPRFFVPSIHATHLPEQMGTDFALSAKKKLEFNMILSGYIFTFIIGVAVGFVFSSIILYGNRLDHILWADEQGWSYSSLASG